MNEQRSASDPRALTTPEAWDTEVSAWAAMMLAGGQSAGTVRTRTDHVRRLARAMGGSPWDVEGQELVSWAGRQTWAKETRRSVYQSVRGFYRWAVAQGRATSSPADDLPRVRAAEPMPRPAPDLVLRMAVAAADDRTRLVLSCAAGAGLRRAEIARINSRDLTQDPCGWSLLVHGKGERQRVVPISDGLALAIRRACLSGCGWAFPGDDGGHLSPRWIGRLATRALPGEWTLHTLRHRFATRAHDGTHDLIAVQRLLGHASVATTQRYVATGQDALRRAMLAAA